MAQRDCLEKPLRGAVPQWRWYPVVDAIHAMHGVQLVVAISPIAEAGDLSRLAHLRQLMA